MLQNITDVNENEPVELNPDEEDVDMRTTNQSSMTELALDGSESSSNLLTDPIQRDLQETLK